eukprot:8228390-Alexandrium_andersonii.AAC.1
MLELAQRAAVSLTALRAQGPPSVERERSQSKAASAASSRAPSCPPPPPRPGTVKEQLAERGSRG